MMLLWKALFGWFVLIMVTAENACMDKTRLMSGCEILNVFIKTDQKGANLTVEVEPATSGRLSMNISNQAFGCNVQDMALYCLRKYAAPVSFHAFKDGVQIYGGEMRSGGMEPTTINGNLYYPMSVTFPRDGRTTITLANGEFVMNVPSIETQLESWMIALISVGGTIGFALLVALAFWVSIRTCCKKRWMRRRCCRRRQPASSSTPKPTVTPTPKKSFLDISFDEKVPANRRPPPSPRKDGLRPEDVAQGEYVVKEQPDTPDKYQAHVKHRVGVDTTKGYHPVPHCYFCYFESAGWRQKKEHAKEKAAEAKEEEKMEAWAIAEADRQDKEEAAARAKAQLKAKAAGKPKAEVPKPAPPPTDEAKMLLTTVEPGPGDDDGEQFSDIEGRIKVEPSTDPTQPTSAK